MNRLGDQTSPYLLQHADNPVHWHPWDDEALALAKRENKPILLSIGYSACHWCHVMAHESFESERIAKVMNEHFINIKVDREERPDLDRIYQTAHQILTRKGGGWPLTMFLDPDDHLPFFGGTYFPPQPRAGMPGFPEVLEGISKAFGTQNEKMNDFKTQLRDTLTQAFSGSAPGELEKALIDRACGQIDGSFDEKRGGFSEAPKFPHPAGLELLLDAAAGTDEKEQSQRALYLLDFTLTAMSCGGLFDHLGGGFYRYSVDAEWTIPHFEKMLYDNGALLSVYALRARQTNAPWFRAVANQTADWMLREMQLDHGGICSSLDADSEGIEGRFYVWSIDEVREVLGDDYDAFAERFGLKNRANFERRWHLRLAAPEIALSDGQKNPVADLAAARVLLFKAREARVRPGRDDKILTSWNALSIRGLADIGQHLDRPDCLAAATRAVDYLHKTHWRNGRLLATSRDGQAHLNAYLDDYAFLVDALLVLLSARWRDRDLTFATALADALLEHFEDRQQGGFFFTSDDHEVLIQRSRSFGDDSLPSGNGVAARALLELGYLLGESRYLEAAERALRAGITDAGRWPSAHATLMRALLDYTTPPPRVILRCGIDADATAWLTMAAERLSVRSRCYLIPSDANALPGLLTSRSAQDGAAVTAYFCSGHQCSAPATSLEEFSESLGN